MSSRRQPTLEERRIAWIQGRAALSGAKGRGVVLGIGDDAAVWRPPRGRHVVLTVDTAVEGTHFSRGWIRPRDVGYRAVCASVSDLAAMAARPAGLLVSLLLEDSTREVTFRRLWEGIEEASRACEAPIVGGNISRGQVSVTVTAIGSVVPGTTPRRDGLRAGQSIWVTGAPGLARVGLLALTEKLARVPPRSALRPALLALRRPRARVEEALALVRRWPVRALIDLSDGLAADLGHLLSASAPRREVGIEIAEEALGAIEPLKTLCARCGIDPVGTALAGGEDYELCFAARAFDGEERARAAFVRRFGVPLTRIARVTHRPGLRVAGRGGRSRAVTATGFEHFTA